MLDVKLMGNTKELVSGMSFARVLLLVWRIAVFAYIVT